MSSFRAARSRRQASPHAPEDEPAGDGLLVDPAPDLARTAHPIGDRRRVQAEPAVRRDQAALAQQHGVAAALTSSHHRSLSWRHGRSLLVGIGPSVGTTPQATRRRPRGTGEVAGDVGEASAHRDRQDVRAGEQARRCRRRSSSARRRWPSARPRHRPGQQVDRRIGRDREAGCIRSPNHGSSSQTSCGESGSAAATAAAIGRRGGPARPRTATAKAMSTGTPARVSATPSVTGPTNCHFTGPGRPARPRRWRGTSASRRRRRWPGR